MKAYVTSIGEPTTDLCVWALERNGFEVLCSKSKSTLAEKLKVIYEVADDDFIRVDADVIVNRLCTPENVLNMANTLPDAWWVQFQCYGWYTQGPIYGGVQFIGGQALQGLRNNIDRFQNVDRPETHMSRIGEFYEPRRFESYPQILGIHGYGIRDMKDVIRTKANRGQSDNYDFELAQKLNEL